MLKPFYNKKKKLTKTGAEIDALFEKADQLPEITPEDAGKILAVDAEGKIVLVEG